MNQPFEKPHDYKKNYVKFGFKTILNLGKLKKGILLIKYDNNLGPINKLRATQLTPSLQQLIQEMIDTGKINTDTLTRLNQPDTKILELLLHVTKTRDHFDYTPHVKTVQNHVDRFTLLQSAVAAGNQSAEIRSELVDLLTLLSSPLVGRIPKHIGDEMIAVFSN